MYVHRSTKQRTSKLIISSHECIPIINGKKNLGLPEGTKLYFYVPHGFALNDPGLLKIIQGKVVPLETLTPEQCPDYELSKFQEEGGETYGTIETAIIAAQWTQDNKLHTDTGVWPADILTIRNRKTIGGLFGMSLSRIFKELDKNGLRYTDIYCSFCRSKAEIHGVRKPLSVDARSA